MRNIILAVCSTLIFMRAANAVDILVTDQITISTQTLQIGGTTEVPDSIYLTVLRNGASVSTGWYEAADAQATAVGNWLVFSDQFQDIDGAGGDGHYLVIAEAYDKDSTIYTPFFLHVEIGIDRFDYTTNQVIVTTNNDKTGYTASTVSDKTGYSLSQAFPTNFSDLDIKVTTGEVIADLDNSTGTLSDAQIDNVTVTAGTVSDKTGYSTSGSITTLDGLNNFNNASDKVTLVDSSAGDISGLIDSTVEILAAIDTMAMLSGWRFTSGAKNVTTANVDTVIVWVPGSQTIFGYLIAYHTGGEAGGTPDSTRFKRP